MDGLEITRTLDEVDRLREETRRALQSFWFPLVLFGALTLGSSMVRILSDSEAMGAFWSVAGPVGGIVTGVHCTRRDAALGLSRPAAPYVVVAVGIMLGAFLLPSFTSGHLADVVSYFAVAAGYLGFAWIEHDGRIALIAGVVAAVALVTLAIAPGVAGAVTAAITGSILLASGLSFRRAQTPSAPLLR